MNIASRRPEIYYNGEKLPRYDAVIPRIGASVTFYGMAVLRQFEMMGVYPSTKASPSAARATSCARCSCSRATGSACRSPPSPSTRNRPKRCCKLAGGAPLVIKLLEGTQGIGVVLADTDRSAKSVIEAFRGAASTSWCRNSSRRPAAPTSAPRGRRQGGRGDETHRARRASSAPTCTAAASAGGPPHARRSARPRCARPRPWGSTSAASTCCAPTTARW
jgi:hypothetical protein